ncbi:MAG: glycosyltransferase family 39 protein [Phycisphaerae bacterium]|nr:glycosyltransferase family 39 protein [Phycisphaerae bacterium]
MGPTTRACPKEAGFRSSAGPCGELAGHKGRSAVRGWAIVFLIILAAVPRLPGITSVGIRFDDESAYALDARLWHRCAKAVIDRPFLAALAQGDKAAAQGRLAELGIDFRDRYMKPSQGFTFLAAGLMFFTGDGPGALLLLNALAGIASVVVLYLLVAPIFGFPTGMLAAGLLAVSPYHVFYSRSAFTEATSGLFVLMGFLFWSQARLKCSSASRRWMFLAGLSMGYAAICHYRAAFFLPVLAAYEGIGAVAAARDEAAANRGKLIREWLIALAGAICPILALDLFFRGGILIARLTDSYLPLLSLTEACWRWGKVVAVDPGLNEPGLFHPGVLAAYGAYYTHWHGVFATVMASLGLIAMFRYRSLSRALAVVCIAFLFVLLLQGLVVARTLSSVLPFLCLSSSVAVVFVVGKVGLVHRRLAGIIATTMVAALALPSLLQIAALIPKRSMFEDAASFLRNHSGEVATHQAGKFKLYLDDTDRIVDGARFHRMGSPEEVLGRLRADGVRWVIADPQYWHYRTFPHVFDWWSELNTLLNRKAHLALELPHCRDFRWEFLAEGPGLAALDEMAAVDGGGLKIYDIQGIESAVATVSRRDPAVK